MLTASQALQKAADTSRWAIGMCDNFVANMFGYSASGYPTAVNHWNSIPAQDKHPGDMNAPAGALMFWGGGAGHVAISDGRGGIFSTDMPSPGVVGHVNASVISNMWHKPYLGWSLPVFQGQVYNVASDASYNVPVPGLGSVTIPWVPSPGDVGKGILSGIASVFGVDVVDLLERAALMFLGAVLMLIGLIRVSGVEGKVRSAVGAEVENSRKVKEEQEKAAKKAAEEAVKEDEKANKQAEKRRKAVEDNG